MEHRKLKITELNRISADQSFVRPMLFVWSVSTCVVLQPLLLILKCTRRHWEPNSL